MYASTHHEVLATTSVFLPYVTLRAWLDNNQLKRQVDHTKKHVAKEANEAGQLQDQINDKYHHAAASTL